MSAQPDDGEGTGDGIHRGGVPPAPAPATPPDKTTDIASTDAPAAGTGGPDEDWVHRGTTKQGTTKQG